MKITRRNILLGAGAGVLTTAATGLVRAQSHEGHDMSQLSELFLFLADRSEHVATLIKPSLESGKIVLCDRYADSTIVYQGYARGLNLEMLRSQNQIATQGLTPDLTLLFDLPVEIGLARLQSKDRLDSQPPQFHEKVRQGFLSESLKDPKRWQVVDSSQSEDEVKDACIAIIKQRLLLI